MTLSIVTTLYNSQKYVDEFYNRIKKSINELEIDTFEIIFVNDGSTDNSLDSVLLLKKNDPNIKIIDFSKNFGHHKAMLAGLSFSKGEFVFLIDSDLEENPEELVIFFDKAISDINIDVFYGISVKRETNWIRNIFSNLFYYILIRVLKVNYPKDVLTVRIMTRNYVDSLLNFKEKGLELFTLFNLNGYEQKPICIDKKYKGSTTYNYIKLISMAIETVVNNTDRHFIITLYSGVISLILSIILIFFNNYFFQIDVQFVILIIISILIINSSLLGIYISKILIETKNRPIYIIKKIYD